MSDQTIEQMSDEELIKAFATESYRNFIGVYEPNEYLAQARAEILKRMDPQRRARLEAIERAATKLSEDVHALINESYGVVGLHLNGDVAPWSEITQGGRYETWLLSLYDFDNLIAEPQTNPPATHAPENWYPYEDPITGFPFFMAIDHPQKGLVPTYGGPFDSYTLCERDDQGEFMRERYDHDAGGWVDEFEAVPLRVVDEEDYDEVLELKKNLSNAHAHAPDELAEMRASAERFALWWSNIEIEQTMGGEPYPDNEKIIASSIEGQNQTTLTAGDIRKVIALCRMK